MIIHLAGGIMRYDYFPDSELKCRCGKCGLGARSMSPAFMESLSVLRKTVGFGLPVTSAVRCPEWNQAQSHTGSSGPHVPIILPGLLIPYGYAADINIWGDKLLIVLRTIFQLNLPFTGIGLNQKGPLAQRFLHLDSLPASPGCPRPWTWTY
jgi:hypothetical protein